MDILGALLHRLSIVQSVDQVRTFAQELKDLEGKNNMGVEITRHCKDCQTHFTAVVPNINPRPTLKCPMCGKKLKDPGPATATRPAQEGHRASPQIEQTLF